MSKAILKNKIDDVGIGQMTVSAFILRFNWPIDRWISGKFAAMAC